MRKILVIDDDKLVLESVNKILKREGYETTLAQNGNEAITKAQKESFDLVISDIRMPGKNGIEAIREMQRLFEEKVREDIPIIFITGYANVEAEEAAKALRPVAYIHKPFDTEGFLQVVRRTIETQVRQFD